MHDARNLDVGPGSVAKVSVINTCFLHNIPTEALLQPSVPGYRFLDVPCFAFLIQHPTGQKVLFDLGVRKHWRRLSPATLRGIERYGIRIETQNEPTDALFSEGILPRDIDAVVLSHHHWDHIGDLSLFPCTTTVVVGPGFKKAFLPGYPENPQSALLVADYAGKHIFELDFETDTRAQPVGPFTGIDYFGDGSFYLIDAPGHSQGHLCGLVRTTANPDTFLLMGADACHHNGEFRPSESRCIPEHSCFGNGFHRYLESIGRTSTMPFFELTEDPRYVESTHDIPAAKETVRKVQDIDGFDNLFVVMAHDASILDHIEFFPKPLNDWSHKGLAQKCRWNFLQDFRAVLQNDRTNRR